MLPIDQRELIGLRRQEATACMHFGLYHAATLTACSGIEMLLKTLFDELIEKLESDDPSRANELHYFRSEITESPEQAHDWGLGRWIKFYNDFDIISALRNSFKYSFSAFKMTTLWKANSEWNKCKHDFAMANPATASLICNLLNAYLEETKVAVGNDGSQLRTMGEFSNIWLGEWESEIEKWYVQNRAKPQAEVLQPLAKLLALVVSLIHDAHVPFEHKTKLMVAANYVLSSVDLMPENEMDVEGLVDDGAVLVLTLSWLIKHRSLAEDHLCRHWQGSDDIISEIDRLELYISENCDVLFVDSRGDMGDRLIWATIRKVATEGPESLWQNYWKEAY